MCLMDGEHKTIQSEIQSTGDNTPITHDLEQFILEI